MTQIARPNPYDGQEAKEGKDLTNIFINVMSDIAREVSLKSVQVGFYLPEISVSFNKKYDFSQVHLRVWTEGGTPYFTHYSEAFSIQEITLLMEGANQGVISQRFINKMQRTLEETKTREDRYELED